MSTTKNQFESLLALEQQIAQLQSMLKQQKVAVLESASNDFASEISELGSIIKSVFSKAKLHAVPFGFVVTSPDFKSSNGFTDIRRMVNAAKGLNQYVNVDVTQQYASQYVYGPKEVKITLTKGFVQSINKEYKAVLSSIEL
jgi:hypothetical protein